MTAPIYKPTTWDRTTVTQDARVILGPEVGAPPGSYRHVRIVVPDSPTVFVGVDKRPDEIAMNRTYEWPVAPTNTPVWFDVLPEQFISAAASAGVSELSIIVEYRTRGGE